MTANAEVLPWERQDGEPEDAYDAFRGYVFQTPPRRMVHASASHSTAQLSRMFNDWRWSERATAYDRHVDRIRQEEREALLREDEKTRTAAMLSMLKGLEEIATREIGKLLRDSHASSAFGIVKVSDLNKLVGQVITMQRLIHGQSTENVATVDANLDKLTLDELREFQRLQAKLAGEADGEEKETEH